MPQSKGTETAVAAHDGKQIGESDVGNVLEPSSGIDVTIEFVLGTRVSVVGDCQGSREKGLLLVVAAGPRLQHLQSSGHCNLLSLTRLTPTVILASPPTSPFPQPIFLRNPRPARALTCFVCLLT